MNFLVEIGVKLFKAFLDGIFRDKANRDLGASQQREKDNESVIEKQEEWAKIDAQPDSIDDALDGLFGNKHRGADKDSNS